MDSGVNAALVAHNEFRAKHGSPPLQLDEKLNKQARQYGEAVLTGESPVVTANLGVNVYHVCDCEDGDAPETIAREAAFGWYDHLENYNWDSPTQSDKEAFAACQLLWKSSKTLGIGIVSQDSETIVVALYSPAAHSSVSNLAFDQIYKDNVHRASS